MKASERKLIESRAYSRGYAAGKKAALAKQAPTHLPAQVRIESPAIAPKVEPVHARIIPHTLLGLSSQFTAAQNLLDGLMSHYLDAVCSGRTERWVLAGKSVIELLASPPATVHCRERFQLASTGEQP